MRKLAIILVMIFIVGFTLSSCRPQKAPCPAYTSKVLVEATISSISK